MTINCRSLRSKEKQNFLKSIIEHEKPDIICGQESHLDKTIKSSEVFPDNYTIERNDRTLGGGGVFIATKDDLIVSEQPQLDTSCEIQWVKLELQGKSPLYIGSYYRAPDIDKDKISNLRESLNTLYSERHTTLPNVILTGDFNVPSIDWSKLSVNQNPQYGNEINNELVNILKDYSLNQTVLEKTRSENIPDLILTTYPGQLENTTTIPGMSDHSAVTTLINLRPQRAKKLPRKIYLYKKADNKMIEEELEQFTNTFFQENPMNRTPKENWMIIKENIFKIINKHIPMRTIKGKTDVPWITLKIKRMIKKRGRIYKSLRK